MHATLRRMLPTHAVLRSSCFVAVRTHIHTALRFSIIYVMLYDVLLETPCARSHTLN